MKPIQHSVSIVWGLEMPLPKLPEGFTVTRTIYSHAIAHAPEGGKDYLIAINPDRLIPIRLSEPGGIATDFDNPILLLDTSTGLKWTQTLPTITGYYWNKSQPTQTPIIVSVSQMYGELNVSWIGDTRPLRRWPITLWAGPIPRPEET